MINFLCIVLKRLCSAQEEILMWDCGMRPKFSQQHHGNNSTEKKGHCFLPKNLQAAKAVLMHTRAPYR